MNCSVVATARNFTETMLSLFSVPNSSRVVNQTHLESTSESTRKTGNLGLPLMSPNDHTWSYGNNTIKYSFSYNFDIQLKFHFHINSFQKAAQSAESPT